MGSYAANNITTWFSGHDMTGQLNSTALALSYDALDATVYQPATVTNPSRVRVAGHEDAKLDEAGFWEAGDGLIDPTAFAALGGGSQVVSASNDGAESSVAYLFRARQFNYEIFGQVGELIPFRLTCQSARGTGLASVSAVRGRVLKTRADVSGTGATGTAYQLGAVSAGQYLYAALHVFSAGTTITAVLESDSDNTFASATTQATFSAITAVGGTWATRVAGPITDTWYRLRITACTGTFSIACTAGIR
ncbi:hypothetical protein [Actinoplanes sp. NPDC049118]|uniref:hypothetical protein n=1 Tax=Actinoplanes sp. NPDC049118 TaxID=3155769 RepID=UPI0033F61DC2